MGIREWGIVSPGARGRRKKPGEEFLSGLLSRVNGPDALTGNVT
jgi:hypothetical protein